MRALLPSETCSAVPKLPNPSPGQLTLLSYEREVKRTRTRETLKSRQASICCLACLKACTRGIINRIFVLLPISHIAGTEISTPVGSSVIMGCTRYVLVATAAPGMHTARLAC